MSVTTEERGGAITGRKLPLCENPLPPLAQAEAPHGNHRTGYSSLLRGFISERLGVTERLIHIATVIADPLRSRDVLIKPLNDPALGTGFMRISTALPEDNRHFVETLQELPALV